MAALVLVVAFIVLAIAKPWGSEETLTADTRGPVPSRAPGPSNVATTAAPSRTSDAAPERLPAVPGVDPIGVPFAPSAEQLWAVTRPRAEWGIRMVVFAPAAGNTRVDARGTLAERWIAAVPVPDGRGVRVRGLPALPGDLVMAIGLTTPDGTPVETSSIRIWRAEDGDLPQRIPIRSVPGDDGRAALFTAGSVATSLESWPRGSYRVDVLLAEGIARLRTVVPTTASAALRGQPLPMGPTPALPEALLPARSGLFVVAGPTVVQLAATSGPALDERATWSARCFPAGGACPVGVIESRTVSRIGVVLPPGQTIDGAVLELLGPAARRPHVIESRLRLVDASGAYRDAVVLALDSPGPLASGIYRLAVTVRTADGGPVTEHWHVEIAPLGTY